MNKELLALRLNELFGQIAVATGFLPNYVIQAGGPNMPFGACGKNRSILVKSKWSPCLLKIFFSRELKKGVWWRSYPDKPKTR